MLNKEITDRMITDHKVRSEITRNSHYLFFHFYFAHYVKFQTAPFQREIFGLTEDEAVKMLAIVAFRSSGKSTIITTSLPLWAILGKLQKKFVLIICQTKVQAKQHMMNLRQELEGNELLKNDLGPFQEQESEWGSSSLVFSQLKARITVMSTEQSIRGLRHHQHRPDLIIGDDLEDLQSVKTRESRDKMYSWFKSEVVPAGDPNTRVILIGNLLHEDSLLMRLHEDMETGRLIGKFKMYPLQQDDKTILWPGKFPDNESIEVECKRIGDHIAWQREYMLTILPDYNQIITREDIQYYDKMPHKDYLDSVRIGVDLAISKRDTADCTAMVVGWVFTDSEKGIHTIYIDQTLINKRMDFTETVATCAGLNQSFKAHSPQFLIEDVGYQRALPEVLASNGIQAEGVRVGMQDKQTRLNIASQSIRTSRVLFHRSNKDLIEQLVGFGTEKHDDLVDAFTLLVLNVIETPPMYCGISFVCV